MFEHEKHLLSGTADHINKSLPKQDQHQLKWSIEGGGERDRSCAGDMVQRQARNDPMKRPAVYGLAVDEYTSHSFGGCFHLTKRVCIMGSKTKNKGIRGAEEFNRGRLPNVFEGKLVSIADNKLVMANGDGREFSHSFSVETKLTCDGKCCASNDLRPGSRIRVTTRKDDLNVATCIEAIDQMTKFESCS